MLIYVGVQIEPGIPLQIMQSTRAEHWPTYFPRTCPLDCRPNRLKRSRFTLHWSWQIHFYHSNQSIHILFVWLRSQKDTPACLLQSVGLPPSQRKSFGRANLSVNQREKDLPQRERTSHSVKGPWISEANDFDMSETVPLRTLFLGDESTLKSWKMLEMRFDALSQRPSMNLGWSWSKAWQLKLCAKQNRAKKTGRWAVFFYVTAPNQP